MTAKLNTNGDRETDRPSTAHFIVIKVATTFAAHSKGNFNSPPPTPTTRQSTITQLPLSLSSHFNTVWSLSFGLKVSERERGRGKRCICQLKSLPWLVGFLWLNTIVVHLSQISLSLSLSPCQLIILSRFLLPLVFALMFLPPPLALPLTLPLVGVAWLFQLSHTFLFLSAFRNCLKTNKLTRDSSDHPPLSLTRVFPFLFFWGYPNQRLIKFIYLSLIFIIKKEQNKQIQQHDVSPTNRFKWGFCPSSINQKTLQIHDKCFIQSM